MEINILEKFGHEEEEEKMHYEVISKHLATYSNYYDISSKLSKLGNIMRVETLTVNFSIKDGLKFVSNTNMRTFWSMIDQGLHCA